MDVNRSPHVCSDSLSRERGSECHPAAPHPQQLCHPGGIPCWNKGSDCAPAESHSQARRHCGERALLINRRWQNIVEQLKAEIINWLLLEISNFFTVGAIKHWNGPQVGFLHHLEPFRHGWVFLKEIPSFSPALGVWR